MTQKELEAKMKSMATAAIDLAREFDVSLDLTSATIPNLEILCEKTYQMYKPTWWQKVRGKARSIEAPTECLGAYLGETIRPIVRGTWIIDSDGRWGLENEKGTCYPFSKVAKRLTDGNGDNITFYFQQIIQHLT